MTKKKTMLIIAAAIVGAILIAIAICAIVANSKNDKRLPTDQLSEWQNMIKDETPLKDVVIAGAHDAGTKGLPYFAETQDRTIAELLECGTRYLDLRVAYADGKLLIYHGPSKGVPLADVLDDVKAFVTANPSEAVILDFQHFDEKSTEAQEGAIKLIEEKLQYLLTVNDGADDVTFVDGLSMGDVRGKCLVTWGRETPDIVNKRYVFLRNNDAGGRQNSTLHSFYDAKYNKKSSAKYISDGLPRYLEMYRQPSYAQGLRVLQGQLTDGLYVFGPRLREAAHTDRMNDYLDNLKTSGDLAYVNIVIRDFVTPAKNCHTLQLNLAKNNVKADCITTFEKMIDDNM